MNEENKFGPKNRWTRIFRKRWFLPSLYLMLAALLISAVFWFQNSGSEQEAIDVPSEQADDYVPIESDGTAQPVMEHQELIQLPVANLDEAEIVTNFFDYNADEAHQANALIHYNNRYYQSTGVDIAVADAETFEVVAALTGTVTEVKQDPLMGNVVIITHENDVTTYYASLDDISVAIDDEIQQGEVIGIAGKNIFGKDNGNHVHFELRKADTIMNPEEYFNQPVANLNQSEQPEDAAVDESNDGSEEEKESTESPDEDVDADVEEDSETEEDTEDEDSEADTDTDTVE